MRMELTSSGRNVRVLPVYIGTERSRDAGDNLRICCSQFADCLRNDRIGPSPLVVDEALPTLQEPVESPEPEPPPEGHIGDG